MCCDFHDDSANYREGTFAQRTPGARAPGIQINGPATHPNALPPNITPSSSPGSLTPAVSGAHVWAGWLHHLCLLGGSQTRGQKMRKKGGQLGGNRGELCPARPAHAWRANVLSEERSLRFRSAMLPAAMADSAVRGNRDIWQRPKGGGRGRQRPVAPPLGGRGLPPPDSAFTPADAAAACGSADAHVST